MKAVEEILEDALKTYKDRGSQYGKCYIEHGAVMKALFPEGATLESEEDFIQFGLLNMMVSKLTRLCNAYRKGDVHLDSIHDLGIYSFMLEETDGAKR